MNRFVAVLSLVSLVQSLSIDDRDSLNINVNVDKDSNSYHHGQLTKGSFEYGLDVDKMQDHHFQHKVKGPDDVTYGCYGFVDPDGKPHLTHYVSDLKGYRVVPPEHTTKIYISRLEKSISNVYQGSVAKDVPWKELFLPPACRALQAELEKAASSTVTQRVPAPTPPRKVATTTRKTKPTTPRPTTPKPIVAPFEPEFAPSNVHENVLPAGCNVCSDLKAELQDIKSKLKTLIDGLAKKDAEEQAAKKKSGAGNATYAYFPVMLSDSLPAGVSHSGQFALPTLQCGRK